MTANQGLKHSKTIAVLTVAVDDAKRNRSSGLDDIFGRERQVEQP
jgi:hypothetical protein